MVHQVFCDAFCVQVSCLCDESWPFDEKSDQPSSFNQLHTSCLFGVGWEMILPFSLTKKSIMCKIRSLRLHTRTGSIYVVANLLNPLIRGWQNYYCHFIKRDLNDLWRFVNKLLGKWCNQMHWIETSS